MSRIVAARVSVTGAYFLNGAVFTSWYARVPSIQERLRLGPRELGIALLGAPIGLLVAQPLIGALATRRGSAVFSLPHRYTSRWWCFRPWPPMP